MAARRGERTHAALGGVAAGIIGGLAVAALMAMTSATSGRDPWAGMKGAALPFLGQRATLPGLDVGAVLLGLASHFTVSIAWGVLFGLLVYGVRRSWTVVLGLAWGLVVWLGMYYVVLPLLGLGELAARVPPAMAAVSHAYFGLFVGLGFLPFQRPPRRPRRDRPVQRPTRGGRDLEPPNAPPP
jgi:hypothetical protein